MAKSQKKRILYLGNVLSGHGFTPTTIETLSERLNSDFDIALASSQRNKIFRLIDMWRAVIQKRKKIDFVLIDTYSSNAFLFAWTSALLCRLLSIPYIGFLHGGDLPSRFKKSSIKSKKYINGARAVVSPSGYLQSAVKDHFQKEAVVIPNYLDLANYPFLLRSEMEEINILWVRSFHSSYQPELAIRTMAYLNEKGLSAKLTMIGPNKDGSLESCQKLASQLGVSNQVEFTGRLPKAEWIAVSKDYNVFLNTTSVDNTPVSVMEAMALGMPVVTTKVGGIPFLFEDGVEGIMVEEQSAKALAESMISLMNQSAKTESISKAARKKAEEWDWSVVREQWLELFDSIK